MSSNKLNTITLYPVDANYLENKLNSIINNETEHKTQVKFNR